MKSGPTPFGYLRRDDGILVPHPQDAPVRVRIFELFMEHQRKKTVADILNAEGYRTRNGAMFTGQTIGRLLNDERVIGIPGEVHALVAKSVFIKCQNILKEQKRQGGAKRKPNHLFAGLAHCVCGDKMYVTTGSQKYTCRSCKDKIPKRDLEAIYLEQIRSDAFHQQIPDEYMSLFLQWVTLSKDLKRTIIEATTTRIDIDAKLNKVTLSLVQLK